MAAMSLSLVRTPAPQLPMGAGGEMPISDATSQAGYGCVTKWSVCYCQFRAGGSASDAAEALTVH